MLWEAATHRRYPQYRMSRNVVMIYLQAEEASMGEIIFSQLLHSYTFEGRGFNHMPAGLSVNSRLEAVILVKWAAFRAEVTRERAIMGEIESLLTRARAEGEDSKMQREEELRIWAGRCGSGAEGFGRIGRGGWAYRRVCAPGGY